MVLAMLIGLLVIARPGRIWEALKGADYGWILLGVPVVFCAMLLDTLKLYWLMRPHGFRAGLGYVFRTVLVVNSASLFLPGTLGGGAVAWYRLSRHGQLRAQAFSALSLNMLLKLVVLCVSGAIALAVDIHARGGHEAIFVMLAAGAVLPILALAVLLWTGLASVLKKFHVRLLARVMPGRVHDAIRKIFESLETYRRSRGYVIAALLTGLGRRLIETVVALFCVRAVGLELGYVSLLWILCAAELAGMLPLTLSGLGLSQVTYVGLLAALGIAAGRAMASHVLVWVAMMPACFCGVLALLGETLRGTSASTVSSDEGIPTNPKPSGEDLE